jgi:hypothetical protein
VTRSFAVATSDVVEIELGIASYVLEVIQGTGRLQFVIAMSNTFVNFVCPLLRCLPRSAAPFYR